MKLNKRFRLPEHPFNDMSGDALAYAKWEYERAADSLACYAPFYAPGDMLFRKKVLDVGCGAGGKSVFYAEKYSADVTGIDLLEKYREQAEAFAMRKRIGSGQGTTDLRDPYSMEQTPRGSFRFVCCDAADTGLEGESFDTIIMNDAFEHLADPEAVLAECARLLKPGGRIFLNFPPYGHPYGEHLSDLIGIPWVHRLFPEEQCLEAYRTLAEQLDKATGADPNKPASAENHGTPLFSEIRPSVSGAERIALRLSEDENGALNNSYINKMTLKRFAEIRQRSVPRLGLKMVLYRELPLRKWLVPLAKTPGIKERFVRMAVCALEKPDPEAPADKNDPRKLSSAEKNTKTAENT